MIDIKYLDRVFINGKPLSDERNKQAFVEEMNGYIAYENNENPCMLVLEHGSTITTVRAYAICIRSNIASIEIWTDKDLNNRPMTICIQNQFVNVTFPGPDSEGLDMVHITMDTIPTWFDGSGIDEKDTERYPMIWVNKEERFIVSPTDYGPARITVYMKIAKDRAPAIYYTLAHAEDNKSVSASRDYIEANMDSSYHSKEGIVPGAVIMMAKNHCIGWEHIERDFAVITEISDDFPSPDGKIKLQLFDEQTGPYTLSMNPTEFWVRYRGVYSSGVLIIDTIKERMTYFMGDMVMAYSLDILSIPRYTYDEMLQLMNERFEPKLATVQALKSMVEALRKKFPLKSILFEIPSGDHYITEENINSIMNSVLGSMSVEKFFGEIFCGYENMNKNKNENEEEDEE